MRFLTAVPPRRRVLLIALLGVEGLVVMLVGVWSVYWWADWIPPERKPPALAPLKMEEWYLYAFELFEDRTPPPRPAMPPMCILRPMAEPVPFEWDPEVSTCTPNIPRPIRQEETDLPQSPEPVSGAMIGARGG